MLARKTTRTMPNHAKVDPQKYMAKLMLSLTQEGKKNIKILNYLAALEKWTCLHYLLMRVEYLHRLI
jgi:hypothetical protein